MYNKRFNYVLVGSFVIAKILAGIVSIVPMGHTVSQWPRTS